MLTDDEIQLLSDISDIWNRLTGFVGDGESRNQDMRELAFHVHGIQNAILANSAAREYPEKFRLTGGIMEKWTDT